MSTRHDGIRYTEFINTQFSVKKNIVFTTTKCWLRVKLESATSSALISMVFVELALPFPLLWIFFRLLYFHYVYSGKGQSPVKKRT